MPSFDRSVRHTARAFLNWFLLLAPLSGGLNPTCAASAAGAGPGVHELRGAGSGAAGI